MSQVRISVLFTCKTYNGQEKLVMKHLYRNKVHDIDGNLVGCGDMIVVVVVVVVFVVVVVVVVIVAVVLVHL